MEYNKGKNWVVILSLLAVLVGSARATGPFSYQVKDIYPGRWSSSPFYLTNVNGTLFFSADDGVHSRELWKSDGTAAGTVLVKDIAPGGTRSGDPYNLTNVNGTLFFQANDDVHGAELWKSDGTEAGTVMVKDILPGSGGSGPRNLACVNSILYFTAYDDVHGNELWKSDGTEAGTMLVCDCFPGLNSSNPSLLTDINGTLYFLASEYDHGTELWKSDGTAVGTVLVKDIAPGFTSSRISALFNMDGKVLFAADDGVHGLEPWISDGTASGTMILKDLLPGKNASAPKSFTKVGPTVLFTAALDTYNNTLWKTDGTSGGTVIFRNDLTGSGALTPLNGIFYFCTAVAGSSRYDEVELWKTDGTADGTVLFKKFYCGLYGGGPLDMFSYNGAIYFKITDMNATTLWKSDGTTSGTVDLLRLSTFDRDIVFTPMDGRLYYVGCDSKGSNELWAYGIPPGPAVSPVILTQPESQTKNPINYARFVVTTSSTQPLDYRWKKNGVPISDNLRTIGSTSNILVINNLVMGDAGMYVCEISNGARTTETTAARLTVNPTLTVIGTQGSPSPTPGSFFYTSGTLINAFLRSPELQDIYGKTRMISTGWTGTGSVPASGTTSQTLFRLNAESSITWNWKTQHKLTVSASPSTGGRIMLADGLTDANGAWIDASTTMTLQAIPAPGYILLGWGGEASGAATSVSLAMNGPHTVSATFAHPGQLQSSVNSLSFREGTPWAVDVEQAGQPTSRTLTLSNTGEVPVTLSGGDMATPGLSLTGSNAADFSIAGVTPAQTAALVPGESIAITIRFAPRSTRRSLGLSAALQVSSNSPVTPLLEVPLVGDSVPVTLSSFTAE